MKITVNPFAGGVVFKKGRERLESRDVFGLAGAALIFFLGLPGHSAASLASTQHMAKQLVRLILVFLGLVSPAGVSQTPVSDTQLAKAKPAIVKPVAKKVRQDQDLLALNTYTHYRNYVYRFEGKASHKGEATANASVLVRVLLEDHTITRGGITSEDGSYSIEVPVRAIEGIPVDWEVEAYTPEFQKLELSGRRIVQEEEEQTSDPIIVTTPVEFIISSSK